MRKIIISFLVVLMIEVIGITAFFVKSVYFVKNENGSKIEETIETVSEEIIKKPKPIGGEKVEEYVDEYGIKTTKYSDGVELLEYPEDVTTWNMQNKDMRTTVIYDAMLGRVWDTWNLRHYYPVTEKFFNEWDSKGWKDLEVLFPGYKHTKEYNSNYDFALYIDDFKKEDKEGIAHAVIRSKYYDTRYDFKYYLDDDYKLDKIEYLSQEVVKDYTKEIEKSERKKLMVNWDDDMHSADDYLRVLIQAQSAIDDPEMLDSLGIVDELKEKIHNKSLLPVSKNKGYIYLISKKLSNYDLKKTTIYAGNYDEKNFIKYQIEFDYDDKYYLTKYDVVNEEIMTEEQWKLEIKQFAYTSWK